MGIVRGSRIVTDGLVFYVDGRNTKSYPGSGTTWYDLSNSYDGTLVNSPTFSNGIFTFDGIDDYVNIDPVVSPLSATTQGTWMAWVKPTNATPTVGNVIVSFGDTNAEARITLNLAGGANPGKLYFTVVITGSGRFGLVTDTTPFSDGVWAHVAAVQDGVEPKMFINGTEYSETAGNATYLVDNDRLDWFEDLTGIDNGRIGGINYDSLGNLAFFGGSIGQVLIYNTALSSAQVLQNFNAFRGRFGI